MSRRDEKCSEQAESNLGPLTQLARAAPHVGHNSRQTMQNDLPRPIFLLGVRESGGHLLQHILSKHPCLSAARLAETRSSLDRLGRAGRQPGLLPGTSLPLPAKLRCDAHADCFAHPAYRPNYYLTEADVEPGDRAALVGIYRAAMPDATGRLLSFDPPNLIRARFLQALFADACFVTVVRDPYAAVAAASRRRAKWGTIEEQALHWATAYETLLAERRFLKRRLLVRYEQLIAEPIQVLEAVCRHMRIDFTPALLAAVDLPLEANERAIATLDARDLRIITRACRRTMSRLGYVPRDKSGAPRIAKSAPRLPDPQPAVNEPRQAA